MSPKQLPIILISGNKIMIKCLSLLKKTADKKKGRKQFGSALKFIVTLDY